MAALTGSAACYASSGVDVGKLVAAYRQGQPITLCTGDHPANAALVPDHCYAVVGIGASGQSFEVYNPWGARGGKSTSGISYPGFVWIPLSDLSNEFSGGSAYVVAASAASDGRPASTRPPPADSTGASDRPLPRRRSPGGTPSRSPSRRAAGRATRLPDATRSRPPATGPRHPRADSSGRGRGLPRTRPRRGGCGADAVRPFGPAELGPRRRDKYFGLVAELGAGSH